MIAAARPAPGITADAHAWRAFGLAEHCQDVTVLGDGAHLNCGMVVPYRNARAGFCRQAKKRTTPPTARCVLGWST